MNRIELREALIAGVESSGYLPCHASEQVNATNAAGIADALLAGPVGDLLAENERLRSKVADLRDIAVDAGVERDRLLATLQAVREYAKEREAYGRRGRTVHSARIATDLISILDAADGGGEG